MEHPTRSLPLLSTALLVCLTSLSLLGCGRNAESTKNAAGLDRVTLMLNWYPEAEHGGFYAAKVHGIFEKYGLDVEIRPGGPNAPVVQELVTERVNFAIGNADDVLLFRQQEANVVALMAAIQNTPRCILVRESSGVKTLSELKGLRLQANAGRPFLDFMKQEGLLEGVQVVPYPGTVVNFVSDTNTAIQAYSFSEPMLAEQNGVKTRKLMLSEAGFNPYASCLIATEDMVAGNEDLTRRMVAACCEGWRMYLDAPRRTNAVTLANNQHGMTAEALAFGVNDLRTLCEPSGLPPSDIGTMSANRWEELVAQFVDLGLVESNKVSASDVYRLDFLPKPTTAIP